MKQPYLKVTPAHNYLKEPFQSRPLHDTPPRPHVTATSFTVENISKQQEPKKNDSSIYDFFGALNY